MKQEIKKLGVLLLLMILFTSSQEKACVNSPKCCFSPLVQEDKIINNDNNGEYTDSDMVLMPISQFIMLQ